MKRRLFTPYRIPEDIPADVRTAIRREMRRQLWPLWSYWVWNLASVAWAVAVGFAVLWSMQGFVSHLGPATREIAQDFLLLGGLVISFMMMNVVYHRLYDNVRRSVWLTHGVCPSCGYNLTGNTSHVCPECGTGVRMK